MDIKFDEITSLLRKNKKKNQSRKKKKMLKFNDVKRRAEKGKQCLKLLFSLYCYSYSFFGILSKSSQKTNIITA